MTTDAENLPTGDIQDQSDSPQINDMSETDDLEEYGVWVKVGPEDFDETDFSAATSDDELAGAGEDETDGALLTEEEEQLLGDLEGDDDLSDVDFCDEDSLQIPDSDELPAHHLRTWNCRAISSSAGAAPAMVGALSCTCSNSKRPHAHLGPSGDFTVSRVPGAFDQGSIYCNPHAQNAVRLVALFIAFGRLDDRARQGAPLRQAEERKRRLDRGANPI